MGAAAYNRGSKLISREADEAMGAAQARNEREAVKADRAALLAQVAKLKRDLGRARRCIAEPRRSKGERQSEARAEASSSATAIKILTRLAFPGDRETP
jgi:hypothetical protein